MLLALIAAYTVILQQSSCLVQRNASMSHMRVVKFMSNMPKCALRRGIVIHILSVAGLILALSIVTSNSSHAGQDETVLTPQEAFQQGQKGSRLILDIRRPAEWHSTGVGKGVIPLTMHRQDGPTGFLEAVKHLVDGKLDRPIAVICASGSRSAWAQHFLSANGFSNVANVKAGMLGRGPLPGWIAQGLPTHPCGQCDEATSQTTSGPSNKAASAPR